MRIPRSPIDGKRDRWAALQFDNAVILIGLAIDNARQELIKTGPDDAPKWEPKYTMRQLLDPAFRLPIGNATTPPPDPARLRLAGLEYDEVRK